LTIPSWSADSNPEECAKLPVGMLESASMKAAQYLSFSTDSSSIEIVPLWDRRE